MTCTGCTLWATDMLGNIVEPVVVVSMHLKKELFWLKMAEVCGPSGQGSTYLNRPVFSANLKLFGITWTTNCIFSVMRRSGVNCTKMSWLVPLTILCMFTSLSQSESSTTHWIQHDINDEFVRCFRCLEATICCLQAGQLDRSDSSKPRDSDPHQIWSKSWRVIHMMDVPGKIEAQLSHVSARTIVITWYR